MKSKINLKKQFCFFIYLNNFFIWFMFFNMSWLGNFLLNKSNENIFLFILILIISFLVFFKENFNFNLMSLFFLFFICLLFMFFNNFFLLYFSFELSMLPIFFLMFLNGTQIEKMKAGNFLMFYAFLFSFPFLFFLFFFNFFMKSFFYMKINSEILFYLMMMFLMKIPMFIFHYWLPKVHVEASTIASMILAGLLLKFGCLGLIFFMFFFKKKMILIFLLSLIGFIMLNLNCLMMSDMKAILAFSSIIHMNFFIFCLIMFMKSSKFSSFLMMISHGFISTIMFFMVGEYYENNMSRLFYFMKNLFKNQLMINIFFIFFIMSNAGIPFNLSFFSEIFGIFTVFSMLKIIFFILIFFMMYSFLFNIFILTNKMKGKYFQKMNLFSMMMLMVFFFMLLNYIFIF